MKPGYELNEELGQPTNNQRARWGNTALSAFANECYAPGAEEEEVILQDLLCDLMHLCDAQGWNFDLLVSLAKFQYRAETSGDEGQPKADSSFAEWKQPETD